MIQREFLGGPIDGERRALPDDMALIDVYTDRWTGEAEWGLTFARPQVHFGHMQINVDRYARALDAKRFFHVGRVVDGQLVVKGFQHEKE